METYREYYFYLKNKRDDLFNEEIIFSLFSDIANLPKEKLLFNFDEKVNNKARLDRLIEQIEEGLPYQYVLGYTYFLGNKFYVDKNVLIPRQETEQLVKEVESYISNVFQGKEIDVLDMCSGSGCIGITLAQNPSLKVTLVDISTEANEVAKKNASLNKTKLDIYTSNLFNDLPNKKYDVIVCNPPYIKSKDTVDESTLKHEPHLALFASPYTYFYEEIFKAKSSWLKEKYILAFEIGEDMKFDLEQLCKKYFKNEIIIFQKDMYDKDRFLYIISK